MARSTPQSNRRRSAVHITLARAARLHRLVRLLAERPRRRDELLSALVIGLRTFYRELERLHRCGVKVQLRDKAYTLLSTAKEAEGRLPFPDPQLSFAEMAELAQLPGAAAQRLSQLLNSVVNAPVEKPKRRGSRGAQRTAKGGNS